jgi:PPOX class probable F420-dependent enzyme
MTPEEARVFIAANHRAVLVTRREAGGVQTSPITIGIDGEGYAVISSRETAYKTRNLRRDPLATVCVFSDAFFGPWVQIEGRVQIVALPEAMDGLIDYYRRISGEHPDWDDYRRAMQRDRRVLIKVPIERAGPTTSG